LKAGSNHHSPVEVEGESESFSAAPTVGEENPFDRPAWSSYVDPVEGSRNLQLTQRSRVHGASDRAPSSNKIFDP
jgi:hypothetical protein